MQDLDNDNQKFYKEKILNSLGYIVLENRKKTGKGINKFSFEYDIGNGLLSKLEKRLYRCKTYNGLEAC